MVKKAVRNKPFTKMETRCDTIIRKTRFKIARTYEGIKGWFKGSIARYSGWKKCIPKIWWRQCAIMYTEVQRYLRLIVKIKGKWALKKECMHLKIEKNCTIDVLADKKGKFKK